MNANELIATVDRLEREMRRAFLRDGSIPTMGVVMDGAGRVVDAVTDAGGDFAGALRASCGRRDAAAVFISAEAWSAFDRLGAAPGIRPADRPDRREVLMSQVEAAGFSRARTWPILRGGGSVRLGEAEESKPMGGRFFDMLRRAPSPIWTPGAARR